MPSFSSSSKARLSTCHPDLQKLFKEVVKTYDCTIICGHRSEADQEKAFKDKVSQVRFPDSLHNSDPSLAVDVAPYDVDRRNIDWDYLPAFYHFAGYVRKTAETLGINYRWGGDWDGDYNLRDQSFNDLVHFQKELDEERL